MADENMKRLYVLLSHDYNKLVRPVNHNSQVVNVSINLKLSRIIDIVSIQNFVDCFIIQLSFNFGTINSKDEKNQIMTTSVWLTQVCNW